MLGQFAQVDQGTALVGLLDPFWEPKSHVTAREWRQFCSPTVPLARLQDRVFTTADPFEVPVEVAHFGRRLLSNAVVRWEVVDERRHVVAQGALSPQSLPLGRSPILGTLRLKLSELAAPSQYRLKVVVGTRSETETDRSAEGCLPQNSWTFWLYPDEVDTSVPDNVKLTRSWSEAEKRLAAGERVVFQPPQANLDWSSPPLDDVPVFWNRLMNPQWGRMLGLWCDTNHPALAGFPTDANCDWQWTQIIRTRAMNLDRMPAGLTPIVSAIDDWNRNWKLGLIFEVKVDQGRLLVSTFELEDPHPVAAQLRRSLLDYAGSDLFDPRVEVTPEQFRAAWFDNRIMHKLQATALTTGGDASAANAGEPNTYWLVGAPARGVQAVPHPHSLTIRFQDPVPMTGVVLMNRQNDRNRQGDIRGYTLAVSDDGQSWEDICSGELASTWDPQRVLFPHPITARHLRLTAHSGFGTDPSAALAELVVLSAGDDQANTGADPPEFKRVRSTSTDVDEGN